LQYCKPDPISTKPDFFIAERENEIVAYGISICLPFLWEEVDPGTMFFNHSDLSLLHTIAHELAHVFYEGHSLSFGFPDFNETDHAHKEKLIDLIVEKWGMNTTNEH
jgi:hypothetical protein